MTNRNRPVLIISILFKSRGAVGGMAQRFAVLADELLRRGKNVELLSTRSLIESLAIKDHHGMHLVEDPNGRISLGGYFTLLGILMKILFRRYELVHLVSAGRLTGAVLFACKISKTRISCTFGAVSLDAASYGRIEHKNHWIRTLDQVEKIDVLCPNHDMSKWEDKISISPCSFLSKANLFPNGYDEKKDNLIVFCGVFEPIKNPLLAIDIVIAYLKEYPSDVTLVLFGQGVLMEQVKEAANRTNQMFGQKVVKFGKFDDYFSTLSKCNVFFSLQKIDNYPSQSMIEAMRMGCKVIATDEGNTLLMLPSEEKRNFLVNSWDPKDFIIPLKTALADNQASKKNADYAKSYHSIDRYVEYFVDFTGLQ